MGNVYYAFQSGKITEEQQEQKELDLYFCEKRSPCRHGKGIDSDAVVSSTKLPQD